MGDPVELDANEKALADAIQERLSALERAAHEADSSDVHEHIEQLEADCRHLHKLLAKRGMEPKHHKYMVENRGVRPGAKGFYAHFHPAEDLLKFIADQDANNDPVDQTIGHEFKVRVFTRRWGHDDVYSFTRTATGWDVQHFGIGGKGDKTGAPGLYRNFRQDSVNYPEALPGYLEYLWEQASEDGAGLTADEVQEGLDQLASWVSEVERLSPAGIFKGYK